MSIASISSIASQKSSSTPSTSSSSSSSSVSSSNDLTTLAKEQSQLQTEISNLQKSSGSFGQVNKLEQQLQKIQQKI